MCRSLRACEDVSRFGSRTNRLTHLRNSGRNLAASFQTLGRPHCRSELRNSLRHYFLKPAEISSQFLLRHLAEVESEGRLNRFVWARGHQSIQSPLKVFPLTTP